MDFVNEIGKLAKSDLRLPPYKEDGLKISFISESQVGEGDGSPLYEKALPLPFSASEVVSAPARAGRTLCAPLNGYKPVYELTLDITGTSLADNFKPGDTIGVLPHNDSKDVDEILNRLGLADRADSPYVLESTVTNSKTQTPKHIPYKSSLRYTFTHCVDLRTVVKKLFLLALSKFTSNEDEKHCLEVLCSKDGTAAYTDYILGKNTCLADILCWFPSCAPPVTCVLSHLPRLLPRPYSIVNSRLANGSCIKICFSVMTAPNRRKGLTTAALEKIVTRLEHAHNNEINGEGDLEVALSDLSLGEKSNMVSIYLRQNIGFSFPVDLETPILMIGPGTGVAPYIGVLEERMLLKRQMPEVKLGEAWLFYGCRNPGVDYIYKKELNDYLDKKILTKLITSFSRIENSGIKYVQDAIEGNGKDVAEFIAGGAFVYVCGDLLTMAKQVEVALTRCMEVHSGRTETEAIAFINNMRKNKTYLVDVWN